MAACRFDSLEGRALAALLIAQRPHDAEKGGPGTVVERRREGCVAGVCEAPRDPVDVGREAEDVVDCDDDGPTPLRRGAVGQGQKGAHTGAVV
jgi:hypothetical protein